jgi:hypothetical protein
MFINKRKRRIVLALENIVGKYKPIQNKGWTNDVKLSKKHNYLK